MRILYHHRTLADGAEGVHIAEMVSAFRALGHEVRVMGLAAGGGRSRSNVISGIRRVVPRWSYELASAGCNPAEYIAVRKDAQKFRPDFLYKRHARNDAGALSAVRALGIPSVLEVNCLFADPEYHRFEPLSFPGMTAWLERRALSLASIVLAVSSPLARQIERAGVRAVVMPNGANPEVFDPQLLDRTAIRAGMGLDDRFTVGWAGILRDWHGLELLLEAVAAIPEVALLIVGDGPARASVEARLSALNLSGRTTLAGRVPHEAMPAYIAAMDVAVVAEDRTRVASPMKLLEYMAMARPVVAPSLDNVRDLIQDGVDGLTFTPGDSGALAATVRRLASDEGLRCALGRNARRKVLETRNWLANAQTVIDLVDTLRVPRLAPGA